MVENNPLSRNISTLGQGEINNNNQDGAENFKRKTKKSNNQNCNAPGAMNAYSQYAQVGFLHTRKEGGGGGSVGDSDIFLLNKNDFPKIRMADSYLNVSGGRRSDWI